ncbi:porin family protein [Oleiagrimonas citrea]|jgi:OmpA-OmpF porin, OOP family|uniref:Porin family protein n=2 Tax=Oleiagrimonas citrea TaxID=1665687 RepID=A0A846ZJZ6_9GAMM|nr:porin family protein [Oleiagrimonas citrea]
MTALALLCAGACVTASAQAKDLTGWFVNAGAGSAHYHATYDNYDLGSDSDTSFQVNAGWRSQFIGVEAGYVDLGGITDSLSASDLYGTGYRSAKAKLSGDGWTLGLNGHFNPTKMWYISARGGLFMWKVHYKESDVPVMGTTQHYSYSKQSTDWYAGVGTGVDFSRHTSLGVNFDYYKIKKYGIDIGNRVYTVNFEYRF